MEQVELEVILLVVIHLVQVAQVKMLVQLLEQVLVYVEYLQVEVDLEFMHLIQVQVL